MKVLVTGGAGYIGSVVVEKLLEDGNDVVVFDNLSKGHREAVLTDAHLVEGDLRYKDALDRLFKVHKVDAVIHMAADSLVGESYSNPAKYYENNLGCSLNLLDTMLANDVHRIVLSSTAAVYGEPRRVPIEETDQLDPTNPYGETKLAVERAMKWYDSAYGLRYASLRYFNAAGASALLGEDHQPESHLIPILLEVAQGKRPHAKIYGDDYPTRDGTCIRDYIHVADLATAHVLAVKALDASSAIYNLGNGNGFSVREVIGMVREVSGHRIPTVVGPRRGGDPAALVASSDKLISELGWQPKYADLQSIVATAWEWHRTHPEGYGSRPFRRLV